jgi:hypothetical protein
LTSTCRHVLSTCTSMGPGAHQPFKLLRPREQGRSSRQADQRRCGVLCRRMAAWMSAFLGSSQAPVLFLVSAAMLVRSATLQQSHKYASITLSLTTCNMPPAASHCQIQGGSLSVSQDPRLSVECGSSYCRVEAVLWREQPAVGLQHHGHPAAVAHTIADGGRHWLQGVSGLHADMRHGWPATQAPVGACSPCRPALDAVAVGGSSSIEGHLRAMGC